MNCVYKIYLRALRSMLQINKGLNSRIAGGDVFRNSTCDREAFQFQTCNCSRKVYPRGRLPTALRIIVTER